METLVNTFFESRVEQLFDLARLVERALTSAGLEYRVIGGLATYLYVEQTEPDAGRLTKDIDMIVRREDLEKIAQAVKHVGLEHRRVAGIDMLVQRDKPSARRAVHLVFAGEKVRPQYPHPTPHLGPYRTLQGLRLIPVSDLVAMKLTSFRLKDQTHIKDLDEAGLITAPDEAALSPILRERLARVRAQD